ncbi:MAG: DUF1232 domain-containing protein [Chloroflexi bacterium]|nr:DUF1232 domain-containing protein [Chloroflexota bacterium]
MAFLFFLRRIFSVAYLMRHPAVPRRLKALPIFAFVYLIFPRDLIIDFRPFGMMDDLIVVTVLLSIFINKGQQAVADYEKGKSDSIDADFQVLMHEEGRATDGPPSSDPSSPGPDAPDPDEPGDDTPHEDLRSHQ